MERKKTSLPQYKTIHTLHPCVFSSIDHVVLSLKAVGWKEANKYRTKIECIS